MKARYSQEGGLAIFCPACREGHRIWIQTPSTPANVPIWQFNGNTEKPTITPSILVRGKQKIIGEDGQWTGEWERDEHGEAKDGVCHSFVTDGKIQFLSDCTHKLAGQTVELQDF